MTFNESIKKYLTSKIFNNSWFEMFNPENKEMGAGEFKITETNSSLKVEYTDGDGMTCTIEVINKIVYIQECLYEESNLIQWLNNNESKECVLEVFNELFNIGIIDIQYQFLKGKETEDYKSILSLIKNK